MNRSIASLVAQLNKRPGWAWSIAALWVALVVGVVAWLHLGAIGLVDETEPLFAEAARQMIVRGDWITPYFNEVTRFDKPPLVYWLMALAYQTVGVNEWSARFPSALAITVLTALGFYTLRRFGYVPAIDPPPSDSSTSGLATPQASAESSSNFASDSSSPSLWFSAFIGAAAIALNPQTFLWSRTGVSDMLLNGCMGTALLCFFLGYAQPHHRQRQTYWYLAFYVFSALAVLTKGPVGVVLPGLIILAFLFYLGNVRSVLQEMRLLWGGLVFVLITLPWYILVTWANGEAFIASFFGYHNIERFTSVVNRHSAPWFFYFLVVLLGFLPWSVHLPVAIGRLRFWRRQAWQQQPRNHHLGLFALIWFTVIFVFFTIAVTKLPSYTIPLLPAAGILVGLFWSDQINRIRADRGTKISHWVSVAVFVVLAIASFYSPRWLGNDPEMPNLPQLMQQSKIFLWAGLGWIIATGSALFLLLRHQGRWLWVVNVFGLITFLLVGLIPSAMVVDTARQLPLRQLADTIVQVQQPQEPVVMIGFGKPSLVFYTQRPITYFPDADEAAKDLRRLARQNRQADSLLLLGRSRKIEEAGIQPEQYQLVEQAGVYQLVRMQMAEVRRLKNPD